MVEQIKEFLSLIFISNINVKIDENGHLIFIDDIYTPFESKTYTDSDYEIIKEGTIKLDRNNSSIEIVYSYVKDFDYERLSEDIDASHKKVHELFSPYYLMSDAPNSELINEEEYWFYHGKLSRLKTLQDQYNQLSNQFPYGFIGTFVTKDLILVYKDKKISGGISLPNGETAFISANIDVFGNIGMIDIVLYDSLVNEEFDLALTINYNNINQTIEQLKEYSILPDLSMQIDFNQILKEGHHSDLKNYMTLIHIFKDIIIGKIQDAMQSEKVKTKNSGN